MFVGEKISFLKIDLHFVIIGNWNLVDSGWFACLEVLAGACFILDCHCLTLGRALSISIKIS